MRNPDEAELAFRCLKLAVSSSYSTDPVADAGRFLAFVLGEEDAAAKLAAVREAISR